MFKQKFALTLLLTIAILFIQVGAVAAQGTASVTGVIQSITSETDASNVTTILVVLDVQGTATTVRLSVDNAVTLGLITLDPVTNAPVAVDAMIGETITLDATVIIPDTTEEETPVHPLAAILASFFGTDPALINGYHEDGYGFGLIAQALWMSKNITDDASLAGEILDAKKTGDYSAFFPEGTADIPTNWGQFKKAVAEKKNSLGVVVSGQEDKPGHDNNGNPHNDDNGQGNGQGNNGHGNGQGQNKDKDKKNKP